MLWQGACPRRNPRITTFPCSPPGLCPPPPCCPTAACQADRRCRAPPPCVTFRMVVVSLRGPGQSPILPFAYCVGSLLSVGRCGWCSCWCHFRVRGAQWLVCCGCAGCGSMCVCASAAPSSWCTGAVLVVVGFAVHTPPSSGRPPPASLCIRGGEPHVPRSAWCPG